MDDEDPAFASHSNHVAMVVHYDTIDEGINPFLNKSNIVSQLTHPILFHPRDRKGTTVESMFVLNKSNFLSSRSNFSPLNDSSSFILREETARRNGRTLKEGR